MSTNSQSVLDRAKNCVQSGHYKEAINLLKPLSANGERRVKLLLGIALAGSGKPEAAAAEFSALSQADTSDLDALNNSAVVYRRMGRIHDALGALNEAIDVDPTKSGLAYNIGNVHKDLGNLRAALMAYAKVIEIDPEFLPAYNSLGKIYEELNEYDKAVKIFKKGLSIDPDNPHGYLVQVIHFYNGYALEAKGDLDEADSEYKAAIEALPDWAEPANNLAIIQSKQGHNDEAIASFKQILKGLDVKTQEIHYARALNNIGVIQSLEGKKKEAITSFQEALDVEQKYVPAAINLGNALFESGDFSAAETELEKILEAVPDDVQILNCLGNLYLKNGNYPMALQQAYPALDINPNNIESLCICGTAHLANNNDDDALPIFEKLLSINPDNYSFNMDMANLFFKRKEFKKASEYISLYLEKKPKDGKAKILLAAISELSEETENEDFESVEELWGKTIKPLLGVQKELNAGPSIRFDSAGINRTVDESTEIFYYEGPICISSSLETELSAMHESEKSDSRPGKVRMLMLLKQLKNMTIDLPDDDRTAFLESDKRTRLELIIEALEGKSGLYKKIERMQRSMENAG